MDTVVLQAEAGKAHACACAIFQDLSTLMQQLCQTGIFPTRTHLRGQRVVHQDVGSRGVGSEGPDGPGGQQIPVVFGLKELSQLLPAEGGGEKRVRG